MARFRASVGHPPKILVKRAQPVVLSGRDVGLVIGSGGSSSYTATHYVAPFASVSGASNDYADLGATSWSNAANSGTPTTLGTAMARAVAGNAVQCAPGTYVGVTTGNRFRPAFSPANSGTTSNPIVFFALHPASLNYGSTSLYTRLSHNGTNGNTSPAIGNNDQTNRSHIIVDGFYVRMSTAFPAPSGGCFLGIGGTNVQFRRIASDCDITTGDSGYNPQSVFSQGTTDLRVYNSRFVGNPGVHRNDACIQTYGCLNPIIENNQFDCITDAYAVYIKGTNGPTPNQGVIVRFNRATNGGIAIGSTSGADIYQNLITGQPQFAIQYESSGPGYEEVRVYNNTTHISSGSFASHSYMRGTTSLLAGGNQQYNNIFAGPSGSNNFMVIGEVDTSQIVLWSTLDNNCYYASGGGGRFNLGPTNYTGLTDWRNALIAAGNGVNARETNSILSDPQFVGGGNYRLQGGSPALGKGAYITGNEIIGLVT